MKLPDFLLTVPAFEEFPQAELDVLERVLVVRDYPDGHEFTREGAKADALFIVIEGKVEAIQRPAQGKGYNVIETFGPGDLFGLVALVDHGRRSATCRAVGPVRAASLPRSAFMLLFQSHIPLALHFQKLIAHQLAHDARIYNQAVRHALISGDTSQLYKDLMHASYEHRGPAGATTET